MAPVTTREISSVTMQQLHALGLNPFAVQLLVESFARLPDPPELTFIWRGVAVSLKVFEGPTAEPNRNENATTPEGVSGVDSEVVQ